MKGHLVEVHHRPDLKGHDVALALKRPQVAVHADIRAYPASVIAQTKQKKQPSGVVGNAREEKTERIKRGV
eukprot:2860911-Pyramimonas_sp.AAC.1